MILKMNMQFTLMVIFFMHLLEKFVKENHATIVFNKTEDSNMLIFLYSFFKTHFRMVKMVIQFFI